MLTRDVEQTSFCRKPMIETDAGFLVSGLPFQTGGKTPATPEEFPRFMRFMIRLRIEQPSIAVASRVMDSGFSVEHAVEPKLVQDSLDEMVIFVSLNQVLQLGFEVSEQA